jgi:hypothetical protein
MLAGAEREEQLKQLSIVQDQLCAEWKQTWSKEWFGRLLRQVAALLAKRQSGLSSVEEQAIKTAQTLVARLVGVSNWSQVTPDSLAEGMPAQQEDRWSGMIALAGNLSWALRARGFRSGLDTTMRILPIYALVATDFADFREASIPYYSHHIRSADLLDSEGTPIDVSRIDNPPVPRIERRTYFPAPMAPLIGERLHDALQPGLRFRLVGQIEELLKNSPESQQFEPEDS